MKFILKGPLGENIYNLMRELGYFFQGSENNELSFVRPPRDYPRFHLYIKKDGETLIFNLHLDQKRPIYPVRSPSRQGRDGSRLGRLTSNGVYKGLPAHQGEYEGELVEKEMERIKQILQK